MGGGGGTSAELNRRCLRQVKRHVQGYGSQTGKQNRGEGERERICLPALIVHLGNSVHGRMEFLIGAVGRISIDTCQSLACFSSMQIQGKQCFLISLLCCNFGNAGRNLFTQISF